MEATRKSIKQIEAEMDAQVVHPNGFTRGELNQAFNLVKNPDDWKGPIRQIVPVNQLVILIAAIEFFTATTPSVTPGGYKGRVLISSPGYRSGPAGP